MASHLLAFLRRRSDFLVPPLFFILITAYVYAFFFITPYPGFAFDATTWKVEAIYVSQPAGEQLQVGDVLTRIGHFTQADIVADRRLELFEHTRMGQQIPLEVERSGRPVLLQWTFSGPTQEAIRARLLDAWWLAYFFWGFGTATFLLLRPRDARWQLLVAFNFVSALVIAFGMCSMWAVWYSSVLFNLTVWMSIPVVIHLHWVFPLRMRRLPPWVAWVGYGIAGVLAIAQALRLLPPYLIYVGFIIAGVTSVSMLIVHYVNQVNVRRTLTMLLFAAIFAFVPAVLLSLIRLTNFQFVVSSSVFVSLPILPGIYFFAIYRRQFGGIELRANRLISLYLFLVLLTALDFFILSLIELSGNLTSTTFLLVILLPLVSAIMVALVFPPFERWVERYLLGIPRPPIHLVERYASRISTSPDPQKLVEILRDDVLPSLLVRQSALYCYDDAGKGYFLYKDGLVKDYAPQEERLQTLWNTAGQYRSPAITQNAHPEIAWVRLAVPLVAGNRRVGLWLLGLRDPDDFYARVEIPTLQALADQTAIALLNHQQSEHLSSLYQVDIDRQEAERLQLALELHDGVLNQLGILALTVDEHNETFEAAYQVAATNIRQIISGLRPTMLAYGLRTALDELADEAPAQAASDVSIQVELDDQELRYSPQVELQLYRIAQEACKNAIQHAHANKIRIFGSLQPDCFDLTIADDGAGFLRGEQLELDSLLANKHFGLAGMIERARLIGAHMEIASIPGQGTRIRVYGTIEE